ncbi:MAG: glycosyltransferase family 39 protein [Bryobacteraceae bacterium]
MMTLNRALLLIFIALLLHSLFAMTAGWDHTIMDQHGFRQAQTAITVEYLLKGGPWFAYETPVLGPPWSIPFEFPLYQWIVASTVLILRIPIDQAGRLISALFFYASLAPLYFLLRRLGLSTAERLPFLILMVSSPLYIFWSRTVMIESCALFFGLLYLAAAAKYLDQPRPAYAVWTLLSGSLAALVKLTTFFGFAVCAVWFLLADRYFRKRSDRQRGLGHLIYVCSAVMFPFFIGYAWSLFAEAQRLLNPLASVLSLKALNEFTLGTVNRLSASQWGVFWSRGITDVLGSNLLILPLVVVMPFLRRKERSICCLSAATFLVVQLTFANLYFVHNYYQYANGVFLIAALGFSIAGLLRLDGPGKVSGLILLGASVVFGLYQYQTSFHRLQRTNNLWVQPTADAIRLNSKPDDAVVIYGMDWSSELPYASHRRAIMVKDGAPPEDPRIQRVVANLANRRLGALAACLTARSDPSETRRRACVYGLEEVPKFEDAICSVYVAASHPKPTASCPPVPPFGNLEGPTSGSKITDPLFVTGWALSQAGVGQIAIYLDGRLLGTAKAGIQRPDVQKAYPQFRDSLDAGFETTVNLAGVDQGTHILRVEIQANDGGRHDLASFPVLLTR